MFTNYRAISLLPKFSKILEKIYIERLEKILNKYDVLSPSQCDVISNTSTSHALLELVEEITNALQNKTYAIGVFVDLKKAFDNLFSMLLSGEVGRLRACAKIDSY